MRSQGPVTHPEILIGGGARLVFREQRVEIRPVQLHAGRAEARRCGRGAVFARVSGLGSQADGPNLLHCLVLCRESFREKVHRLLEGGLHVRTQLVHSHTPRGDKVPRQAVQRERNGAQPPLLQVHAELEAQKMHHRLRFEQGHQLHQGAAVGVHLVHLQNDVQGPVGVDVELPHQGLHVPLELVKSFRMVLTPTLHVVPVSPGRTCCVLMQDNSQLCIPLRFLAHQVELLLRVHHPGVDLDHLLAPCCLGQDESHLLQEVSLTSLHQAHSGHNLGLEERLHC
mmetsp:Transcript_29512/g.82439  ORF Transcript_29512/g.82439 Transcript_29512/m.82439 type:complete len:283 (-) Transcript_29512:290-1138(-)